MIRLFFGLLLKPSIYRAYAGPGRAGDNSRYLPIRVQHLVGYTVAELYRNEMVVFPRVPHLIWQHGEGADARILYIFANVGNSPVRVDFNYDKGLNIAPPARTDLRRLT